MKKFILIIVSISFVFSMGFFFRSEDPIKGKSISSNTVIGNSVTIGTPSDVKFSGGFAAETFEGNFPPSGWTVVNSDGSITYDIFRQANGPSFSGSSSVFIDFYSYSTSGQKDYLYSPNYTNIISTDSLKFDYAYAQYPGYVDSLNVYLSTDNGATYSINIFRKGGASLATAPSTSNQFVPTSSQWATFSYPLGSLAGSSVKVMFQTYNNYGNDLYIDNLSIGTRANIDVAAACRICKRQDH